MQKDVIIIGSGPGAAWLAKRMTDAGRQVLVLERGKNHTFSDNSFSQVPMMNLVFTDGLNSIIRGITAGGSSMLYFGSVISPPEEMFCRYGISLQEEEKTIRSLLPVNTLPNELLSEASRSLITAAASAGYSWQPLEKFIYTDRISPGQHTPTARWNAREPLGAALKGGAEVLYEAKVNKILYSDRKATGVEFEQNGKKCEAHAPIVISAAGGVGSASLFRQSGLSISKGFFCDPLVAVLGNTPDFKETYEPLPMLAGERDVENGIMLTDMPLPWPVFSAFALQTLRPDLLLQKSKTLIIMVKIRDELAGDISVNDKVHRKLTSSDKRLLDLGTKRAKQILAAAGSVSTSVSAVTSAHPGGSIRIGDRIDENLESDIKGLFVCDASVIPEPWGLPPTMTLLCLAERLSRYLTGGSYA